jgi:hypothetical protein
LNWNVLSGVGAAVLLACGAGSPSESGAPASAIRQLSASDFAMPRYQIARDNSLLWRILTTASVSAFSRSMV